MKRALLGLAVLSSLGLIPTAGQAQTDGFSIGRFDTAEHGSDWFVAESLDLRGHGRFALGLVADWSFKPLVLYDVNGDEVVAIVRNRVTTHLGGGVILWERLRFAFDVPLVVYQNGDHGGIAPLVFQAPNGFSAGDVRLGLDLRLAGTYGGPATLVLGAQVHLPSGDRATFSGDGAARFTPRLMLAGDAGIFTYSARAGFVYRAQNEPLANIPTGNEVSFAASMGLRLADKKLLMGPELFGSTVVSQSGTAFQSDTTPLEIIFGIHYRAGDVIIGAGGGTGLTRGAGTPQARAMLRLTWFPAVEEEPEPDPEPQAPPEAEPEPEEDRDGDEILDKDDACPDEPGDPHYEDLSKHGCPPPPDRDGDEIIDADDACPDEPGEPHDDPDKHGCPPPPDSDGDTIIDDHDACPHEAGEPDPDPDKHGCPPPKDRDGDEILDDDDACPDVAGPANSDPDKHGCPIARVEKGQIKITERVEFRTNSAKLLRSSDGVLDAVLTVLQTNPDVTRIRVEGHTDNRGRAAYNKKLSQKRAASVVKWLVRHGVEASRLYPKGHGMDRPIDSNYTSEGRQRNRRVEFHIEERDGEAVESEGDEYE